MEITPALHPIPPRLYDKISDLKAAFKMGAKPVLVRTGYGEETIKELNKFSNQKIKKKTIIFDDLAQFADYLDR